MNKIKLIIQREYLSRVKKRSFVVMTFLGPILMAAMFIIPVYISTREGDIKKIAILDETGIFRDKFTDTRTVIFSEVSGDIATLKGHLADSGYYALLHIPKTEAIIPTSAIVYSSKQASVTVTGTIRNTMQKEVERLKLEASGVDPAVIDSAKTKIQLATFKIDKEGNEEKSFTEVSMVIGYVGGFLIYIFIFMYGSQVMRGVIEEKSSRIVEVILSSIKPFQLMMGKIVGIAMVGLTQFVLWILLTAALVTTFTAMTGASLSEAGSAQMLMTENSRLAPSNVIPDEDELSGDELQLVLEAVNTINYGTILVFFLFFFIGGYLLYGALFAAIGAAVDNEADTQQFMLPITIPLILSIVLIPYIINNPEGPLVFWASIIPFTSPIAMMARIPFGVPYLDLVLSVTLLTLGFLGTTWLAGRIYRTGILLFGKKVTYHDLWKWVSYRG
ncbi:MAG TPA: ABC transporter permease [Bacteroidales bacterium]|nr:ABC transporter permease [Bacteroidales bacterium]